MTELVLALFVFWHTQKPLVLPPAHGEWYEVYTKRELQNEVLFQRWYVPRGTVFYQPADFTVIPATVDLRLKWKGENQLRFPAY